MIKTIIFITSLTLSTLLASGQTTQLLAKICNSFCEDSNFRSDDPASYILRKLGHDMFILNVYNNVWNWEKQETMDFLQFSTTYKLHETKDSCVCKPHGLKIMYDKNGNVRGEEFYENGLRSGFEVLYYSTGKVASIANFVGGKREGSFISYFENGIINERGAYSQGVKEGVWWLYSPEGILKASGSYAPNYMLIETNDLGDTLIYKDSAYTVLKKAEYRTGLELDRLVELMQVKEISDLVFPLKIYKKDGEWTYFDEKGNIVKKEFYKKGALLRTEE